MALVSEKCATTDERWGDGAVWRGVFPTAGVTPPNCAKAFAAPILTNGFRSLVQSGLKSDVAPCRLCATTGLMHRSKGYVIRSLGRRGLAASPELQSRAPWLFSG